MIIIDKPSVSDLYIPRSANSESCGSLKKGCFGRKDIIELLQNYVTIEDFEALVARVEALENEDGD